MLFKANFDDRGRGAALASFLVSGLVALVPFSALALSSVNLAWTPSTGTNIAGYHVYYGAASRTYTNMVFIANATNTTISGLTDGVTYYFAATAVDNSGLEGDYSNEATATSQFVVNQPPTLNPLSNLKISENAGLQTVNLSGISSGASNEVQTLTVTATSGNPALIPNPAINYTSPNSTGSLTFTPAASGIGLATITVTVNDNQPTNNSTSHSFTVTVNPLLAGQTPLTNVFVLPNDPFLFALYPPYTTGDEITFSLPTGAPEGATIQSRKGLPYLAWTPSPAQASTTNLIVIQVTDTTVPALSTNETVLVIVLDYVAANSSWASVQAGQNCSVPIYLSSSEGVTSLLLTMDWFPDRFTNPSLLVSSPKNVSASVQNQITNLLIHLQTAAGEPLQGSNLVAQLNFETIPNQSSAFVYLPFEILSASKPNGMLYVNPLPEMERVVVVNDVPLMEANAAGNTNRSLTLFGKVGANYQLQYLTDLGSQGAWQPLLNYSQTNIQQTVTVDPTLPLVLYRLLQR